MTANNDPTVALMRKVAVIRKASGLSGKEFAKRLDCSPGAARQIDRTVREGTGMRLDTFLRYCRALGIQITGRMVDMDRVKQ